MKVTTLIIQNLEDDVAVDNERGTSAGKRKTVLGFINRVRSSILAKHVIYSRPFAGFGHMSVYILFVMGLGRRRSSAKGLKRESL